MFKSIKQIHFIGIGGSGMSGIAEVLLKLGYTISGSDLVKNAEATRLEKIGAHVFEGHAAKNIEGADVVVTSTAVPKTNPEVKAAHKKNIPVIPRIEMLAEIARLKYTIAIAGTHGKTTTTSLVGQILKSNNLDPTVIVGGKLKAVGTGGVLGHGDYLVAEADESDGSFLKLSPAISVVTNIDNDHMDFYKTEDNLLAAFAAFSDKVPFYGVTFLCGDDAGVKKILPRLKRGFLTYGFGKECDYRATDVETNENGSKFKVFFHKKELGTLSTTLAGQHNVLNSLAALAVGLKAGLTFYQVERGLMQFDGVGRRLEMKGTANGAVIVDDYGHHPTEIKATLQAVRSKWPRSRLFVLFQPHRYSRTKSLHKEFAAALTQADWLYLFPIYPAGEKPIKGVSSKSISKHFKKKFWTDWVGEKSFHELRSQLKEGDVVLTLGAGNVWKSGEELIRRAASIVTKISEALPDLKTRLKQNEPLSRHCTWAIGGPAEVYVEAHNLEELKTIQKICRENKSRMLVLGWGSNILLPDEGIKGVVVRLRGEFEEIRFEDLSVRVGAGVHLPRLAKKCAEMGQEGVEALAGVPGTVGGALMTNAGTPRGVIGDVVQFVDVLNADGSLSTLYKDQIELKYRSSNLVGRLVISALLQLKKSSKEVVSDKIKKELESRERTQPLGTKNVGSVFRNPPNEHAARLIEAVGLKGHQEGHVRFSPKHANFIENLGGASAKEALDLMKLAQQRVREKFHIDLEPEVKIVSPA